MATRLFIADGPSLMRPGTDGAPERVAWIGDHGFPGIIRDICAGADGILYVTTTVGTVASFHPETHASEALAAGLDRPNGVACSPRGSVIVVESGTGRVLEIAAAGEVKVIADGLNFPTGVAIGNDGACYVSETGAQRVVRVDRGIETVMDGLDHAPGNRDTRRRRRGSRRGFAAIARDFGRRIGRRQVVASNLPVGAAGGFAVKPLPGIPGIFPGPFVPFAGVATGPGGQIFIAGDADGSVLALEPSSR